MNKNWREYLGMVGVVTGSMTFMPQVYQAWVTKSVGDLSIWMILILLLNVSIWLIYGITGKDRPMILANIIIMSLSLALLYFKLTF